MCTVLDRITNIFIMHNFFFTTNRPGPGFGVNLGIYMADKKEYGSRFIFLCVWSVECLGESES